MSVFMIRSMAEVGLRVVLIVVALLATVVVLSDHRVRGADAAVSNSQLVVSR